ncbi:MAG: maltodextrin glucosidase [Oscillospiraceae bacterium]|nr:maltodextrin glucosidase [Oscillospiraceae bacterium]
MWAEHAVFYQIYPLGLCGAPQQNDGVPAHRILALKDWAAHVEALGANAVYLSPVFESDEHGYDTRDYRTLDCRLGTNEDFREVVRTFHAHGVRVVIDAVFNHVGRNFWAFRDVREKKWDSAYKDWFHLSFDGNTAYNDGFWYEAWEGCYNLVKLNLRNPAVVDYLLDTVRFWTQEFDVDGLRLDVAYCLDLDFIRRLRAFTDALKPEFFLVGETLHGDYNRWVGDGLLHSCTNYECYKGLYSSLNSMNLFELVHSLKRQFGPEPWTLYKGKQLFSFVDNHDVTRAASILTNPRHLPLLYALLFGMPGIPCVYYGSEWGEQARKQSGGDWNLRPAFDAPRHTELTAWIARLAHARRSSAALCRGDFMDKLLTNRQTIFQRRVDGERVLVAVNADAAPFRAHCDYGCGRATDLLTGRDVDFGGGLELPPYGAMYLRCER